MTSRIIKICTIFTLIGLLMPLSGCRRDEARADQNGFGPGCVMIPVEYCVPVGEKNPAEKPYNGNHQDLKSMVKGRPVDTRYNGADPKREIKSEPIALPSEAPVQSDLKRILRGEPAVYSEYDQPAPPAITSQMQKTNVSSTYKKAMSVMRRGDYVAAGEIFDQIAANAPSHKLAPNALYWRGECFYARGLYQEAISYFSQVIQRYPDSAKAPDAQLKIVYSYNALGDGLTAMANLRGLLEYYPKSRAAEKVRSGKTVFKNP